METINKVLEIQNIKKTYTAGDGSQNHALKGVSLDIFAGEIIGLLGPNGAGKTTLASIVVTLIPPTDGSILCLGKSIFENIFEYRKLIGFCPQKPNLYSDLTIEQNLFFGAKIFGCSDKEAIHRAERAMEKYRLTRYRSQFIKDLSGGYQQRASIARALINDPKIILFDEPTVGLDPHIRRELWAEIQGLKAAGKAIVLTTHYLDEAEFLSDRVCLLADGLIKFLGTPTRLKESLNKNSLEEVLCHLFAD